MSNLVSYLYNFWHLDKICNFVLQSNIFYFVCDCLVMRGSPLTLFNFIVFALSIEDEDTIKLQLNDVGLDFSWPIERIKEVVSHLGSPFSSTPTSCSLETVKSLTALVDEKGFPETKIGLASGVCAVLWLYTSILGYVCSLVFLTYFFLSMVHFLTY